MLRSNCDWVIFFFFLLQAADSKVNRWGDQYDDCRSEVDDQGGCRGQWTHWGRFRHHAKPFWWALLHRALCKMQLLTRPCSIHFPQPVIGSWGHILPFVFFLAQPPVAALQSPYPLEHSRTLSGTLWWSSHWRRWSHCLFAMAHSRTLLVRRNPPDRHTGNTAVEILNTYKGNGWCNWIWWCRAGVACWAVSCWTWASITWILLVAAI